jgi:hypothetical protein
VEAVIPGAQGRILGVLARTTADLNLRTIARLAGVSPAQASRVLPDLVALGMVERKETPPSSLFRLVDENVAAQLVRSLSGSYHEVLRRLGEEAARMSPAPASVIIFGSFARGDADADSDIDVLIVRADDVPDDEAWASGLGHWWLRAARIAGNGVEVIEDDARTVGRKLRRSGPLWGDIRREGIVVYGATLDDLRADAA